MATSTPRVTRSMSQPIEVQLSKDLISKQERLNETLSPFERSQKIRRSPTKSIEDDIYEPVTVRENVRLLKFEDAPAKKQEAPVHEGHIKLLEELVGNGKMTTIPQYHEPPTFHHASGNPQTFLRDYDRAALINGWDLAAKITYLTIYMVGPAEKWFELYLKDGNNAQKTWEDIKTDIIIKFGNSNDNKKDKYLMRSQHQDEDIKNFFFEKQMLAFEVSPEYGFTLFKQEFIASLRTEHREAFGICNRYSKTYEEMEESVKMFSDLQKTTTQNNQPINTRNTFYQPTYPLPHPYQQPYWSYPPQYFPYWQPPMFTNQVENNMGQRMETEEKAINNKEANNNKKTVPTTRTHDGRPICTICKKAGHSANVCWYNKKNPNEQRWRK